MAGKKFQEMLDETIRQYHERRKHLTEEEAIAAIGFLIFCMGVGKIIIAYATRPSNQRDNHFPREKQ